MIDQLLTGEMSFGAFDSTYGRYYYEHLPVHIMRSADGRFVTDVLEMLEFTTPDPTIEEREQGWITGDEFVEWVRRERQTRE